MFYVEHECQGATGIDPKQVHIQDGKARSPVYVVQMFYTGEISGGAGIRRTSPNDFVYTTDPMAFPDKHSSGYTNCPLCGSHGKIKVDRDGMVPISEETESTIPITG